MSPNPLKKSYASNSGQDSYLTPSIFDGSLGDLFDSLPEGVMVFNHQREILYINGRMQELWGFPDGILTGQESLASIIDKVIDPTIFESRINAIVADIECESQEVIKLKNGKVYQRNSKPLIVQGENLGRFWTYRDISKEHRTEQALRESEKKYKELYDLAERSNQKLNLINHIQNIANSDADLTKLVEVLVDGLTNTFGYALAGFYVFTDNLLHLVHSAGFDGEKYYTMTLEEGIIGRAAKTQTPIFIEDVRTDPSFMASTTDVMSEISVPVFDRNELFGVLNIESKFDKLTLTDLSFAVALCEQVGSIISRIRLYSAVKMQEEKLQRIFDSAPTGIVICATDGTFLQANKAFETTVGYSIHELKSMSFIDLTHPEEIGNNLGWTNRLLTGDISHYEFEKRYIHKDGSSINVFLQVSLLPSQPGEARNLIAQVVNLTKLKTAETALLQHQKMESIGVLAGGIAHDFNNLLVALKAQSSLALVNVPAGSQAGQHIEKAIAAADRAAELTAQLLAYTGQGQFKVQAADLNYEIEQNSQLLKAAIPKNVQIIKAFAPQLPNVIIDKAQIQQVLMNLIINGAEAMGGKTGRVEISTTQTYLSNDEIGSQDFMLSPPAHGRFVEVSVQDTGEGMDRETLSKIFDPFFTTKFTGRGLGLAAVLGIVRSHNGGVRVISQPDQGTTFCIFFPVAAKQEKLQPPQNKPYETGPLAEVPITTDGFVLLIDDDSFVRDALSDLFQLENLPLLCAADGQAGVDILKEQPAAIALVILDLSMPGLSSVDTFAQLRQLKPDLPIFLCSGFTELKINDTFANEKHEGFIAKPFEIDTLISTVRRYL